MKRNTIITIISAAVLGTTMYLNKLYPYNGWIYLTFMISAVMTITHLGKIISKRR